MYPVHIFDIREAKIAREIAFEKWKVVAEIPLLRPDLVTPHLAKLVHFFVRKINAVRPDFGSDLEHYVITACGT